MKLPRDLSGTELAKALGRVGYRVVRQSGSHLRLSTDVAPVHHVTIPAHSSLKIGTLAAIVGDGPSEDRPRRTAEALVRLIDLNAACAPCTRRRLVPI